MIMWIVFVGTLVFLAVWLIRTNQKYGLDAGHIASTSVTFFLLGVLVFGVAGMLASSSYGTSEDQDWKLVSEDTYTIAEDSKVGVTNYTIEFIENTDGELRNRTEDFDRIDYVFADADTVVVQKYHAELGNLIFPWGLGQDRTTITVK